MPVVDDLTKAISRFIDALVYDLIKYAAEAIWWLIKSILILSYQIISVDEWLSERAFPPLIQGTNSGTKMAATLTFVIALMILGLTYLLAVWIRLDVVSPRKAFLWFLAGALFFQIGPQLYQGFHHLRTRAASAFFASGLQGILGTGSNPFAGYGTVDNEDHLIPYDLCDNRDPYFDPTPNGPGGTHNTIRGSDVALSFLRATGYDIMGYPPPYPNPGGGYCGTGPYAQRSLPQWWLEQPWNLGGYFFEDRDSSSFGRYGDNGRRDSIENAFLGLRRLGASLPLVILAVVEALIYLLLTIAEGIVFLSFGVAIIFSYFKRTEVIALSVIDLMIQLIVQTIIIGLFLAVILGFMYAAALSLNSYVILGMGTLAFFLMLILLWSGVKAVFTSINRLFEAMSRATGGGFITPSQAAMGGTGLVAGSALLAAGGGLAAGGLASSILRNENQDGERAGSRALRGAGSMMRASMYSMAVGTGNPHVSQVATLGGMLGHTARTLSGSPRTLQLPPTTPSTSPTPTTTDPTSSDSDAPAIPGAVSIAAVPQSQPSLTPQRRGYFYPDFQSTLEDVGEEIEDTVTTTSRASRPTTRPTEGSTTLADVGEEIEDAVRDTSLAAQRGLNRQEHDTATRAAAPVVGHLRVTDVASVIGDAIGLLRSQRLASGANPNNPVDFRGAVEALTRAMGITPTTPNPMRGDVTPATTFVQRAVGLGLSDRHTAGLLRAVKNAPHGRLSDKRQQTIVDYVARHRGLDQTTAQQQVGQLLSVARAVPAQLTAYGAVSGQQLVPTPPIKVEPKITVKPQVTVETGDQAPSRAQTESAALAGSDRLVGDKE